MWKKTSSESSCSNASCLADFDFGSDSEDCSALELSDVEEPIDTTETSEMINDVGYVIRG